MFGMFVLSLSVTLSHLQPIESLTFFIFGEIGQVVYVL